MTESILIISSEFPPGPGGIGQHAYSLAHALSNLEIEVMVLAPADNAMPLEIKSFDEDQQFKIERYPRFGIFLTYLIRLQKTWKVIQNNKKLFVILTGKFSLWQGLFIRIFYPNTKTIAVLHGSEVNLPNVFLRWFTHLSISYANVIIAVSTFTKSLLPERILKTHNDIRIIPNGINYTFFSSKQKKYPILKGFPCLLTVGHVSPRKGQHRVIKAIPNLLKEYPELHYHVVGRIKNRESIEQLAISLGVEKYITFHGCVSKYKDLSIYYQQADIFMLLSENQPDGDVEGFGIVALEANFFGVPVIGARFCGVEDAVNHLNSGFLVDSNNTEEILEGINFCLRNQERLKQGSLSWAKKHQWSTIVNQYVKLLI